MQQSIIITVGDGEPEVAPIPESLRAILAPVMRGEEQLPGSRPADLFREIGVTEAHIFDLRDETAPPRYQRVELKPLQVMSPS